MVKTKEFKFNEARADGGDKTCEPKKNFQPKRHIGGSGNTSAYVQILGIGMDTHDTTPSVLLFFDKQRFIFNAGEGLQRFCTEHKIKLSKIDHICFSRVCSETAGGLPGLLLTLAGMGDGVSVHMWGPSNLNLLVDAMKCFIPRDAMVHTHLISQTGPLQTDNPSAEGSNFKDVKLSVILLQPNGVEESAVNHSDVVVVYVCELHEIKGKFHKEKADALGVKVKTKFKELTEGKSVKSDYLDITVHPSDVIGPPVPGPIVIIIDCPTDSHAQELFCTQSLNEYYWDSGNQPQATKIVNCVIHLGPASVVNSIAYNKWMKNFGSAQHVIAGHVMKQVENPILKSSARMAARLNYLCPQLFPPLSSWPTQDHSIAAPGLISSTEVFSECKSISAENLLKFTLRPHTHLGLDRSNVPSSLVASEVIDELLLESPDIVDAAQDVKQLWQKATEKKVCTISMQDSKIKVEELILDEDSLPRCLENIQRDDLEIIFLGTGSSQPSKYRNVTAIYLNLFSRGSLLLDCGEGTLAQLRRRYGMEGSNNAVKNLAFVWISHIHADHHAGLARILALRRDLLKGVPHEPLIVIGPSQLERFLDAYQRLEDLDMQFFDNKTTTIVPWEAFELDNESNNNQLVPENNEGIKHFDLASKFSESLQGCSKRRKLSVPVDNVATFPLLKRLKKVLNKAGLERLVSFPVVHCPEAFGVILKAADRINSFGKVIPGWKVVYSGDTRPCLEMIEASQAATILIHEAMAAACFPCIKSFSLKATFEDGMDGEAIAKNHSTTKEAIEVGDSAAAYRIILTHFSQRYPKVPALDEISMQKTCIAFDFMSINIADLPVLPKVIPYLKLLFKSETMIDNFNDVETDA
ncbi:zinc phosphodiesterase ELAC protein 2-like protein [Corchorus capsularis]|uniref:ribonuclease Z n=1 Tax=Corchorus capsularis TaxID=210143 RepID=A0A1R3H2H8_COCAP|nr:zinc phosphodiesterase ELAC protein 2-like protein [Corchorus capsularis]